ncbi:hypothetical protein AcW1_003885 [Taiwanofungus camphoratus]|nr:hypothetical protein AcV5_003833 [Antrodia cinnamomea]KAI0919428.1 hypothetical protein AcV7_006163 [Antrodia cinnamomea]KAI0937828.1 hypothetical protein AcW1_003885 [Antrodia cinnamomea]
MAHIGLLPQRHASLSGYKAQGKDAESALDIFENALALGYAGAFAIVLEAIPGALRSYVTRRLHHVPTIGIDAGWETNGQVLVWDDAMGTWSGHRAKFVRRFADIKVG